MTVAPEDIIEELSGLIMQADFSDKSSLKPISAGLKKLETTLGESAGSTIRKQINDIHACLQTLSRRSEPPDDSDVEALRTLAATLQQALENGGSADAEPPGNTLILPAWVDEAVFDEFISGHPLFMEDIESDILALEDSGSTVLGDLKGKIHTLKGEAGMLGLNDIEQVCHTIEDCIEAIEDPTALIDNLLKVKDWMVSAFQAYGGRVQPKVPVTEILNGLKQIASSGINTGQEGNNAPARGNTRTERKKSNRKKTQKKKKAAAEKITPENTKQKKDAVADNPSETAEKSSTGTTALEQAISGSEQSVLVRKKSTWDDETREVAVEFLQESEEGINEVDEILLSAEQEGVTDDQVNALFRVFHSIKGVSGFLELDGMTELAHTTETMLHKVRKGELRPEGMVLDLLFTSTEMMRRMLVELREAMGQGLQPASEPGLSSLVGKLRAATEGTLEEEEPPSVSPGEKLGEILSKGTNPIAGDVIAKALESQKQSGRRLGDELASTGAVPPTQVAQAIRAQNRANAATASSSKLKEVVKVDLERVDNLVSLIGELVIVESMIANAPELLANSSNWLRKNISQMTKITSNLQDIGTRMRMLPVRGVFMKMARMVRDLSHKAGKNIVAEMYGEGTEVDRSMVEQIADPLVHMIRNAVDHGIEPEAERIEAGKPAQGKITLRAFHKGDGVVIEVADDGRGLNKEAILAKAREREIIKEGDNLSDQEIYNLIFKPGFSTAKKVTEISGRGVGMDVVMRNIESVRGRVKIDSVPGRGSTFTLMLPLTLAIIDGLLVISGKERYIIPSLSVIESIQPECSSIFSVTGKGEIVSVRGETIPLLRLDRLLNIPDAIQDPSEALVVVAESHGRKIGLLVDDVLTQQQVVIKGLGSGLAGIQYLSGAAIMSDGRVGLILNMDRIVRLIDGNTFISSLGEDSSPSEIELFNTAKERGFNPAAAAKEVSL